MYLETAILEKDSRAATLHSYDPLIDLFRQWEERIKQKSGREIRLLPERVYKEGISPEPDDFICRDERED